jgi:hypothetical protein
MMHTATEKEAYDTALLPIWQPVRAHSSSAMKVWYPRGYRGYRIAWMKETFSWDIYENKKQLKIESISNLEPGQKVDLYTFSHQGPRVLISKLINLIQATD